MSLAPPPARRTRRTRVCTSSSRCCSCRWTRRGSRSCGRCACSATPTRPRATRRSSLRTAGCRRPASCSARVKASRSRSAGSAPAASTTACARSARRVENDPHHCVVFAASRAAILPFAAGPLPRAVRRLRARVRVRVCRCLMWIGATPPIPPALGCAGGARALAHVRARRGARRVRQAAREARHRARRHRESARGHRGERRAAPLSFPPTALSLSRHSPSRLRFLVAARRCGEDRADSF